MGVGGEEGLTRPGRRAIFLDRDGVINRAVVRDGRPYPPATLAEFAFLPDIAETLLALKAAGFHLFVVTNQPDVARGSTAASLVEAFHARILANLPIDRVYTCYHDDAHHCVCRKPKPGMLFQAAAEFSVDLKASFLVGDRWRDIDAGSAAGCKTIFLDYGYNETLKAKPDFVVKRVLDILTCIKLERGSS